MSKRRYESTEHNELDVLIVEYLKRRKCEKTLVLFQNQKHSMRSNSRRKTVISGDLLPKFEKFLMNKFKKNKIEDDLGFEINFASFQSEPKVSQGNFYILEFYC